MSGIINSTGLAIVAAAFPVITQLALAQDLKATDTQPFSHSPLAVTDGEMPDLRLARPLSHYEELALTPMDHFKECDVCPEMIVVPPGQFLMGASEEEPGSTPDERPQHKVNFAQPFSVGRFPVTFAEWDVCVTAKGCAYHPTDQGWGRGKQPVINIRWGDAKEYVTWLSRTTGRPYRLLSEAEREYVTRAGTTTAYWFGESLLPTQANFAHGNLEISSANVGDLRRVNKIERTLPVQSFTPNPWGLYQVHGNVYDWVEDCWNENYDRAPNDGSAWLNANCNQHVLRGGAFSRSANTARSAARLWFGDAHRLIYMSVRVARTLRR